MEDFLNYLTFEKKYSKNTIQAYESDLNKFQLFLKHDLTKASYQNVIDFNELLIKEDYNPKSRSRMLSSLKSFYKYNFISGKISINPMEKIIYPKIAKTVPQVLSLGDLISRAKSPNNEIHLISQEKKVWNCHWSVTPHVTEVEP